jgi:hypothetical protein
MQAQTTFPRQMALLVLVQARVGNCSDGKESVGTAQQQNAANKRYEKLCLRCREHISEGSVCKNGDIWMFTVAFAGPLVAEGFCRRWIN